MQTIRPGIVLANGDTIYPTGHEYILAFALRGCQWAIDELEKINPHILKCAEVEKQLFEWKSWECEYDVMTFRDCILKVRIGDHMVGSQFPYIIIDWRNAELRLGDTATKTFGPYQLEMKVK